MSQNKAWLLLSNLIQVVRGVIAVFVIQRAIIPEADDGLDPGFDPFCRGYDLG